MFSTAEPIRPQGRVSVLSSAAVAAPVASPSSKGPATPVGAAPAVPLLLSAVLCLVALLVAPEQPRDQEAICQRHNGVDACRVW